MTSARYRQMMLAASERPALWRLVLGAATVFVLLTGWFAAIVALRAAVTGTTFADAAASTFVIETVQPAQTVLILILVGGLLPATLLAAAFWQRRTPRSLIGPPARTLRHFAIAAGVTLAALIGATLLSLPFFELPHRGIASATWLAWLPVALLALVLQTGGEEILFRGYLQSQIAARLRSDTAAVLIPGILFGLVHFAPGLPLLASLSYMVIAGVFGIFAADLTLRTGSIGAAWGFHLANNSMGILVIAPEGSLGGLALWQTASDRGVEALASPLATLEIVVLLVNWLLIRRALGV